MNRSQYGTLLNGEDVKRALLHEGDVIQVGSCQMRVGKPAPTMQGLQVTAKQINPLHNRPPTAPKRCSPTSGVSVAPNQMIGESPAMHQLLHTLERIATSTAPVLLIGESGTGKELAASAIHRQSSRSLGPYIPINCAAITPTLFESELFGHEKGSFSGATRRTDGAFRAADGGTLFLDEVGELPLELQAKLLRVLETGEVRRIGATSTSTPDVRVVAATNRDLGKMIREGDFRPDLAYRLSILSARLPPLRERKSDIPALAAHLLHRDRQGAWLSDASIKKLKAHSWPGNIRELRNVLLRAAVIHGGELQPAHLQLNDWGVAEYITPNKRKSISREAIIDALSRHKGNRTHASRELVIPRSTLLYKMKLMGIEG